MTIDWTKIGAYCVPTDSPGILRLATRAAIEGAASHWADTAGGVWRANQIKGVRR